MTISIISAVGNQNQIGLNNKIPWKLRADLVNFKKLTTDNIIIMSRRTAESMKLPLKNRINVVLTQNEFYKIDNCLIFNSLKKALDYFKNSEKEIFICGGSNLYKEALNGNYEIDKLYITNVDYNGIADTFFPEINYNNFKLIDMKQYKNDQHNNCDFTIKIFTKNKLE